MKNEVKEYSKGMGLWIIIILSVVLLSTVAMFATGGAQALYNRTMGVQVESSKTDQFYATKGYSEGMVQDLSKAKLELAQTKDVTARGAIVAHVNEEFANFDERQIRNLDLRQFLIDCRNGNIQ